VKWFAEPDSGQTDLGTGGKHDEQNARIHLDHDTCGRATDALRKPRAHQGAKTAVVAALHSFNEADDRRLRFRTPGEERCVDAKGNKTAHPRSRSRGEAFRSVVWRKAATKGADSPTIVFRLDRRRYNNSAHRGRRGRAFAVRRTQPERGGPLSRRPAGHEAGRWPSSEKEKREGEGTETSERTAGTERVEDNPTEERT